MERSGGTLTASDEPLLSVAAVARRLGVAPGTLRTWDRRYGLGPSAHEAGAHRRYTRADLERLTVMRRLTLDGRSPAEAAALAIAGAGPNDREVPPPTADAESLGYAGRVLSLPGADSSVRGLGRAAMSLDSDALHDQLLQTLERLGTITTWERVIRPVVLAVTQRQTTAGEGWDVEHVLRESVGNALRAYRTQLPLPPDGRPALLAATGSRWSVLALDALQTALTERRLKTRTLGALVDERAIPAAHRRLGPSSVFLWSDEPSDATVLSRLPATRPPAVLLVGGQGWRDSVLPPRVTWVPSMTVAVESCVLAAGLRRF